MNIREFRKSYGQNFPLKVCRDAYGYVLNGNLPKPSISTACAIYAKDFVDNRLVAMGYRAKEEIGYVHIYRMMTETVVAQKTLQKGELDFDDRFRCIAALGENYRQELVKSLDFPDDLIVSVYNHFGKFISVVALEGCKKASQVKDFKHIGHILAINSLGYYDRYLDNLVLINEYKEKPEISYFDKYLLMQPIELTEKEYFNQKQLFPRRTESVRKYLNRKSEELDTCVRIASIEVFGNFTDF
ncbi:MAG: hypothetical protein IJ532_05725 [Alphaproteobacteria bacterium]|nr:hypothetical protein [Alphaproteobacteria bacterium]